MLGALPLQRTTACVAFSTILQRNSFINASLTPRDILLRIGWIYVASSKGEKMVKLDDHKLVARSDPTIAKERLL